MTGMCDVATAIQQLYGWGVGQGEETKGKYGISHL